MFFRKRWKNTSRYAALKSIWEMKIVLNFVSFWKYLWKQSAFLCLHLLYWRFSNNIISLRLFLLWKIKKKSCSTVLCIKEMVNHERSVVKIQNILRGKLHLPQLRQQLLNYFYRRQWELFYHKMMCSLSYREVKEQRICLSLELHQFIRQVQMWV